MREAVLAVTSNPLKRIPGVAIMLLLLFAIFGASAPGFLSEVNIANVLGSVPN